MPTILKGSNGFTFTIVIVDVHLWSNEGLRVYKCLMPTSGGYNGTVMRLQMFNIKHIDGSKDMYDFTNDVGSGCSKGAMFSNGIDAHL